MSRSVEGLSKVVKKNEKGPQKFLYDSLSGSGVVRSSSYVGRAKRRRVFRLHQHPARPFRCAQNNHVRWPYGPYLRLLCRDVFAFPQCQDLYGCRPDGGLTWLAGMGTVAVAQSEPTIQRPLGLRTPVQGTGVFCCRGLDVPSLLSCGLKGYRVADLTDGRRQSDIQPCCRTMASS